MATTDVPQSGAEGPDPAPAFPPAVEVRDLDWKLIRTAVNPAAIRARMPAAIEKMETLLDRVDGPGLLFDSDREHVGDRAIRVNAIDDTSPLWIIGDLHGDLLALEASLALIHRDAAPGTAPRIVFLGDFVDDEGSRSRCSCACSS